MKLPEVLKDAIENADWKKVCIVYTAITGKKIEPPKPKLIVPDFANMDIDLGEDDSFEKWEEAKEQEFKDQQEYQDDLIAKHNAEEEQGQEEIEEEPPSEEMSVDDGSDFIAAASKKKSNPPKAGNVDGRPGKTEEIKIAKRKNRFKDDLSFQANLTKKVNPKLNLLYGDGSNRVKRDLIEGAVDTGATVDVQCSLCDKWEQVAGSLAARYSSNPDDNTYRCNICCTPKGQLLAARKNRGK